MKKRREHTVVLVLALLFEVGLIVLFGLKAGREGLEVVDWKHLAAAGLALFFLYIVYVEIRIKRAGQILVEEKIKTHTLLESLPQPVAVVDSERRIVTANASACRLLGLDPVDAIGRDFAGLFDPAATGRLRNGSAGKLEASVGGRSLRLTVEPLRGEAGSLVLLEERKEAEAAAPEPARPTLFDGWWESIAGLEASLEKLDAESRRGLAGALVRARKAMNALEDPAALPRPNKGRTDVAELAREAQKRFATIAKAKSLRVETDSSGDTTAYVDRDQVLRAFEEIVFNAVSYTSQGSVEIGLEGGPREITVQVTDSGIGIPAEEFDRVFDFGFVGSNQLPETKGGSGFGLALAKRVIESHGGSILVESRVGKGTRITLNIPRA